MANELTVPVIESSWTSTIGKGPSSVAATSSPVIVAEFSKDSFQDFP